MSRFYSLQTLHGVLKLRTPQLPLHAAANHG